MVQTDEERKAQKRKYGSRPEIKARKKEYDQKPEVKARKKEYNQRPEVITKHKVLTSSHVFRTQTKATREDTRLLVLQHYSKHLSNSEIPCCNCCGENFHLDFLAIDHIAGKRQMDSEPELVKLGYSSKLQSLSLQKWLIRNDFPDGFQILCSNCNMAKGFYGTCPHEK